MPSHAVYVPSAGFTVGSEMTYGSSGASGVSSPPEDAAEEVLAEEAPEDAAEEAEEDPADAPEPDGAEDGAAPQAAMESVRDRASASGRNRRISRYILSEHSIDARADRPPGQGLRGTSKYTSLFDKIKHKRVTKHEKI